MLFRNLLLLPATTSVSSWPSHEWTSRVAQIQATLFLQKQAVEKRNYREAAQLNDELRRITH